jgi:thiosulfate reductase cytochrome b subunit
MQPLQKRRLVRGTRGAAAWALPSVALALVPKCPMCIAAYLAIGGGLGVSLSTAAHLQTALMWLCWSTLLLLTVRLVMRFTTRRRGRMTTAPRVRRDTLRSTARASAA